MAEVEGECGGEDSQDDARVVSGRCAIGFLGYVELLLVSDVIGSLTGIWCSSRMRSNKAASSERRPRANPSKLKPVY